MSNSQPAQSSNAEPSQNQVHQDALTSGNGDANQRSGYDSIPDISQYPSSMTRQSFTMSASGKEVFENENDDRVTLKLEYYLGRRKRQSSRVFCGFFMGL